MKQGRRRTPTALKLVHNMPSAKNVRKDEPMPQALRTPPPPPFTLSEGARQEWERVTPEMCEVGLLTNLDLAVLSAYCEEYANWRTASEIMIELARADPQTRGLLVQSAGGSVYLNPIAGARNRAANQMAKYANVLGLTPSGRASVGSAERGGNGGPAGGARDGDFASKYGI